MAKLQDIVAGCTVKGLTPSGVATVKSVSWIGNVLNVIYEDAAGNLGKQLIYEEGAAAIEIQKDALPWSFDGDGELMRLVSEAYRINLAHLFDPYLAVHTSQVEPLPHQIAAVYKEMLPRVPLRYVLADDPGAGKTIMTGLFLKELLLRGDLKRCLIVSPGSLAEQWQDELYRKFNLRFEILTNDRIESSITGNVFLETNFCIARLDKLARNQVLQEKLKISDWDLIVVDEAHKMSATVWSGEVKYTKRFQLGRLLSNITRNFLLLTATPHNGKEEDFQLFMSLIDQDRFEGAARNSHHSIDISDVMRRLVKEELLKFDGTPLFPERRAYTVNYDLSPKEAALYHAVTEYVQGEFNRADKLNNERKTTVGFALTTLQRRLASSPEAIYQSLKRRRGRLEERLSEEKLGKKAAAYASVGLDDEYDEDDLPPDELEATEDNVTDQASAATTIKELEAEIQTLRTLERVAAELRASGEDRKWDELSRLLQDNEAMFGPGARQEKLIIFTEHKDTLKYLAGKIRSLLGRNEAVVTIHGGMLRDERRKVEELFKQDKNVRILIATDAAGEGINLQRAHLMVNYDLPWNPNRLEQRFGRIHRIGQTEVCHLWNLVAKETREGYVFQRLFAKLEEESIALGGRVFDILGKLTFENRPLRELLIEAIRYGDKPEVRERLYRVVDNSLEVDELRALLDERALTEDSMDYSTVMAIREEMERIEAHKLQPHFVASFFMEAFKKLGGRMHKREEGRYELTYVPSSVRNRDMQIGFGEPVLERYERICFEKSKCNVQGKPQAALVCPGHPLMEAVTSLILEKHGEVLKHGCIFIDDSDFGKDPRILFYLEDSIQDGTVLASGAKRVVSKHVHFVELKENGTSVNAGYAPYLDYRPATPEEAQVLLDFTRKQDWLMHGVEERAKKHAVSLVLEHFKQVKEHKLRLIEKTEKAVKERLFVEINYWDSKAGELKQKEAAGKGSDRLNSINARRRADELAARLQKRMDELAKEKLLAPMPPVVIGGAVVIPKGLLHLISGTPAPATFGHGDLQAVEHAAMKAVMDIETRLGFRPKDVSAQKCGYDVESKIPEAQRNGGYALRMIEVKGRSKGAKSVTVSRNEILTALNKPEEYILAIVEVDGDKTRTVYLRKPFSTDLDFSAISINYDIAKLIRSSEILYRE